MIRFPDFADRFARTGFTELSRGRLWPVPVFVFVALCLPLPAQALDFHTSHNDPIAPVILGVTGILFIALLGRFGSRKLGMPSVLGELIMGILVGNLAWYFHIDLFMVLREGPAIFDMMEEVMRGSASGLTCDFTLGGASPELRDLLHGPHGGELIQVAHAVDVFSRYGVIFLLFLVGLDTSIDEMREVGPESARVAIIGVALPFALGFVASLLLLPDAAFHTSLFLGATLAATSVGITAMVLQELQLQRTETAHIILGAAVIDDILGLLILAIVSGIVVTGSVDLLHISVTVVLATLFLLVAIFLGPYLIRGMVHLVRHLDLVEAKMFVSYMFVMVLAWIANLSGLATIIGAFTAGLILHDAYFKHWDNDKPCPVCIKDLIMPLEVILVPIFFVLMGVQVKIETFLEPGVLLLAGGLLVAAVLGKVMAGLGAETNKNRWAIGVGMLPRGEVGLVFAAIGKSLGVIDDALFSSVVLMIVVTTLVAPTWFKFTLRNRTV